MTMRLAASTLVALSVTVPLASRGVEGRDTITYYQVAGYTAREVRDSLNRLRPTASNGWRADAVTRWHVGWTFRQEQSPAGCRLADVRVILTTAMRFPAWVNQADAAAPLVARWRAFVDALMIHENGHKDIAAAAATAIEQALTALPPQPACLDAARIANQLGQTMVEECREKQRRYDIDTASGRTQGVRFP